MEIYFIRHGIAESFAKSDFERKLTVEGKIKLNESFREFVNVKNLKDFIILSSPLVRAKETADILSSKLKIDYETAEFLKGCYTDELLKNLKEYKSSKFILISHEPYISFWLKDLTGKNIIVSRGSIHYVETK